MIEVIDSLGSFSDAYFLAIKFLGSIISGEKRRLRREGFLVRNVRSASFHAYQIGALLAVKRKAHHIAQSEFETKHIPLKSVGRNYWLVHSHNPGSAGRFRNRC